MKTRILLFIRKHSLASLLTLSATLFSIIVLPATFQQHHVLSNLEPYPDGLLYALTARNVLIGRGLQLNYENSTLPYWVSKLYSIVLVPAYLINDNPQAFFLMNILMGLISLVGVQLIVWKTTHSLIATFITGVTYLAHAYILWLPSLPMAENLLLLIFVGVMALVMLPPKNHWVFSVLLTILAVMLVATKQLALFSSIILILFVGLKLIRQIGWTKKKIILGIIGTIIGAVILWMLFFHSLVNLMSLGVSIMRGENRFFGFEFLTQNIETYTKGLLGQQSLFLWKNIPLTSFFVILMGPLFLITTLYLYRPKFPDIWLHRIFLWFFLLLIQFPVILIFYVGDLRYIVTIIPMLSIAIGWSAIFVQKSKLKKLQKTILTATAGILFLGHLFTQQSLFREIISANILGKTVGWQYESIMSLDRALKTQTSKNTPTDTFLITALPPFLYDAYAPEPGYHLLPLSSKQEFVAKGEWVWGSATYSQILEAKKTTTLNSSISSKISQETAYSFSQEELLQLFSLLLSQNKTVYVSNAYITHQQVVILDFEKIKQTFNMQLVSEGCSNACNLYKISQKLTTKTEAR